MESGEWFVSGIRNEENRASNMGRETLILPVKWEKNPTGGKK
jgi:hypothetical protein